MIVDLDKNLIMFVKCKNLFDNMFEVFKCKFGKNKFNKKNFC